MHCKLTESAESLEPRSVVGSHSAVKMLDVLHQKGLGFSHFFISLWGLLGEAF